MNPTTQPDMTQLLIGLACAVVGWLLRHYGIVGGTKTPAGTAPPSTPTAASPAGSSPAITATAAAAQSGSSIATINAIESLVQTTLASHAAAAAQTTAAVQAATQPPLPSK